MVWIPLRQRLPDLPLILAGPVLRRTEATSVTVWLALKRPCRVTLRIYDTVAGRGEAIADELFQGSEFTIALGQHLHLVAVTAKAPATDPLQPGHLYAYDLICNGGESLPAVTLAEGTAGDLSAPLSYFDHGLPTFVLPPTSIHDLTLLHGSCRKTHGQGIDALPIVDDLLAQSAADVAQRPHQLFLTGDQVYGDDVADPWLFALIDASEALLGWDEVLPTGNEASHLLAKDLPPGDRAPAAENLAGLTAGLPNKPDHTNSHLLSLGEYLTAYLFAWSPTLWGDLPQGEDLYRDRRRIRRWNQEAATLHTFYQPLGKVRRALANIPTYMICDDHEISDDWYLNRAWCVRVLGRPLGRRVVQNGLLAYALAQAWGNTPEQFAPGTDGERLLNAAQAWAASHGTDTQAETSLGQLLGLPRQGAEGQPLFCADPVDPSVWVLDRHPDALRWHYTVRSACHEVIVLDTRTWRGYPAAEDTKAVPMLLSPGTFQPQLGIPLAHSQAQGLETLMIAPTNVVSLRAIDWIQRVSLWRNQVFGYDVGDAWNLNQAAFSKLLLALFAHRDRITVLSGDIHFGFAVRLSHWSYAHDHHKATPHLMVQLTASAFKNADLKTQLLQTKIKALLPEPTQDWLGWNQPAAQRRLFWWSALAKWLAPVQRWLPRSDTLDHPTQPTQAPDWRYRIAWVKRQPSILPPWGRSVSWLRRSSLVGRGQPQSLRWLRWLWSQRWLQEGPEVVGDSNLGLVRFLPGDSPSAILLRQDLYWCPPWQPDGIVISRFETPLAPDADPRRDRQPTKA